MKPEEKIEFFKNELLREKLERKTAESALKATIAELHRNSELLKRRNMSLEREISNRTKDLEANREQYQKLVESAAEIIYETDSRWRTVYFNPVTCRVLLYSPEELTLKFNLSFVAPSHQQSVKEFYKDCYEKRIRQSYYEFPVLRKDGEVRWIGQNAYLDFVIMEGIEVFVGMRAVARDITEKYYAQKQIQLSEDKYRRIMENMELGFLEVDLDGIIVRAYDKFCQMLGYEEYELLGKDPEEIFLPTDYKEVLKTQHQLRMESKSSSYEVQLRKKNGELLWVIISGGPVFDEKGNIVGSVGIHYDISEQKRTQAELAEAKRIAENAQKAEQDFLANMSHEIRTPLNAILGVSHLLYDTKPTAEQIEYLDIIKNSSSFLHSLISDVLDMAKIEAGKVEVKNEPFDLGNLLQTIQRTFQLKAQEKGLKVELNIEHPLSYLVIGDETLLHQILLNIVGNAEKFTQNGFVSIKLNVRDDKYFVFTIQDTGIGMEPDKQQLIFEKFKQIHQAHETKTKGTGLGLSIVRELVELLKGEISLESQKGVGTTIRIEIPLAFSTEKVRMKGSIEPWRESSNIKSLQLLVVEDNLMNRKYISSLLEKWEIASTYATDGIQAVEHAFKQPFDLILMDIQMPLQDGYEATYQIRNIPNPNQLTPIVALTASAMAVDKKKAINVGMNDVLTKPFTPIQLRTVLQRFSVEKNADDVLAISPSKINTPMTIELDENLDQASLDAQFDEDVSFKEIVLETFLESIVPQIEEFAQVRQLQQWDDLARIAHKMAPAYGMVGLTKTMALMKQIDETIRKTGINPEIENQADMLLADMPRLIRLVEAEKNATTK